MAAVKVSCISVNPRCTYDNKTYEYMQVNSRCTYDNKTYKYMQVNPRCTYDNKTYEYMQVNSPWLVCAHLCWSNLSARAKQAAHESKQKHFKSYFKEKFLVSK